MIAASAPRAPFAPRALCGRCRRPSRVCVCALLPALAPRARVLILQHPRERRVAIGTAAMASRCLVGSSVVVGTHVDAHPAVRRALTDPLRRPVLLWPGCDALDIAKAPPTGPISLLVLDGTWSTAKKLLKFNPAVAALPRYAISPTAPSQYRIRREPRAECLSTIEALATALGVLEGDPEGYCAMLEPFRAMVDAQLEHILGKPQPRDHSRLLRRARKPWLPPLALRDPSRVVLFALETNSWPLDAPTPHPEEIVHWTAVRGDESERFEAIVRPTHPLAPCVTAQTGLAPDLLLAGSTREGFLDAVRGFLRDGDALATWGSYALRRMRSEGVAPGHEVVHLRRVMADRLHRAPGSIERCAESLGLAPAPLGPGRAGRRLGLMLALLRMLAMEPEGPRLGR